MLVVEDEAAIRRAVAAAFTDAGHQVATLPDGARLEEAVTGFRPDLVVVDVMLPGDRDGLALTRLLRARVDCGVIVVTARDTVADRLRGFDSGADDYLVKPFALEELLARATAVLRRLGRAPGTVEVGDLVLDPAAGVATRAGEPLNLTSTEFRLLAHLAANPGRVLSKTRLLTQVWGYEDYDPNLVEVYTSTLRRKLEAHGPRVIFTERNLGYVLRA